MIREALEYIVGLSRPEVVEVDGKTYSDRRLNRVDAGNIATAIDVSTLSSLVDYILDMRQDMDFADKVIVNVESPTRVTVMSSLDSERRREIYIRAGAEVPRSNFGFYLPQEEFCIWMMTGFSSKPGELDKDLILKFAGTVEKDTVAQYSDDGVTQKATVKTGIASKADAIVPNPVALRPFRTFHEVEQPLSKFIFRMKDTGRGVECALYEADGGAWKKDAVLNIREYLFEALKDADVIILS